MAHFIPVVKAVELEATHLRVSRWAVHPKGQLGTMGWSPFPWTVVYVTARDADTAIRKATPDLARQAAKFNYTIIT